MALSQEDEGRLLDMAYMIVMQDPWSRGIFEGRLITACHFCGEGKPRHNPSCLYLDARELIRKYNWVKGRTRRDD